jgi:hypothetical protein
MARPKGSKNKAKVLDGVDYAAQIAEKNTAAESIAQEIATIGDDIATLNAQRKAKEAELKNSTKRSPSSKRKRLMPTKRLRQS